MLGSLPAGVDLAGGPVLLAAVLLGHVFLRGLGLPRLLSVALPAVAAPLLGPGAGLTTAGIGPVLAHPAGQLPLLVTVGTAGLFLGAHLWHVSSPARSSLPGTRTWLILALLGLDLTGAAAAFGGPAWAAGAGGTMAALGLAGLASVLIPGDLLRREVLSVLLTILLVAGLATAGAGAEARAAADAQRAEVLAAQEAAARPLAAALASVPTNGTVLVEAACPVTAFGSQAALDAVVALAGRGRSVHAVLLRPGVTAGAEGLTVVAADGSRSFFAYGDRLFAYSEAQPAAFPLRTASQAGRYFLLYPARARPCERAKPQT